MFEATKSVCVWCSSQSPSPAKPEKSGRGEWFVDMVGSSVTQFAGRSNEYRLSYTAEYSDKAAYEADRKSFENEFCKGLRSAGYPEDKITELLEKSAITFYEPPMTFRQWRKETMADFNRAVSEAQNK